MREGHISRNKSVPGTDIPPSESQAGNRGRPTRFPIIENRKNCPLVNEIGKRAGRPRFLYQGTENGILQKNNPDHLLSVEHQLIML
jgi:hypothetical protein